MTETNAPTSPPAAPPTMQVIEGEKPYRLRDLNAGDTRTVGAMIARVTGDTRIRNALIDVEQGGASQNIVVMAIASSLLDRASHDVYVWIAGLIGEDKNVPTLKEYRKREREEAREEERLPRPEGELRYERELEIVERVDSYPPNVPLDVINEIMEQPTFDRFLTSCSQLGTAAKKGFERFRKPSKNGSDSPTDR